MDWLVNYLQNKPEVIRYMVEHLLDHNGDGQVTSQEMMTSLQQQQEDWIGYKFSSHINDDIKMMLLLLQLSLSRSRSTQDVIYNLTKKKKPKMAVNSK